MYKKLSALVLLLTVTYALYNSHLITESIPYVVNSNKKWTQETVITNYDSWENTLKNAIYDGKESIELKIQNYDKELYNINNIYIYGVTISSEGFILTSTANITYTFDYHDSYKIVMAINNPNIILNNDEKMVMAKIQLISDKIITPEMNLYQKELAIHDYMVNSYRYDEEGKSTNPDSHSIRNLLNYDKGVCDAYAFMFKALCNLNNIECEIVTGFLDGSPHAWNLVKIGEDYYNVDVTADDPVPDNPEKVSHHYFNISDSLISKSHKRDKNSFANLKCDKMDYNYYVINKAYFTNYQELLQYINTGLSNKNGEISFYADGIIINNINSLDLDFRKHKVSKIYMQGNLGSDGEFIINPFYS